MKKCYKFWMKSFLSLIFLVWYGSHVFGQVSTYSFSQNNGTYTPITGGLLLGTTTSDDQRFVDPAVPAGGTATTGVGLPIGFNFTFNGTVFDRLAINNNGWISLGSSSLTPSVNIASTSSYSPLASTSAITPSTLRNRISALGRDLQAQAGSELRLETVGTAPNRVCVVQWTNYKKFGGGGTGDNLNFQIRLYETSNRVEVVFGAIVFNTTSNTADVGLGGTAATDFNNRTTTTDWNATTAGTLNTSRCTMLNTVTVPVNGLTMVWVAPPPTPPAPTQDPTPPTCNLGTQINLAGPPPADVTWYWQTSATGTSMANPYTGPYSVFSNGTYYARAYNTVTSVWSTNSSSITITNFPLASPPPAPTANVNPSCAPTGSVLSVAPAPAGYDYYWQGTLMGGTNNTLNASATYNATSTGTYYVSAFETATQCWSNTVGIAITVDAIIPFDPVVSSNTLNLCSGDASGLVNASVISMVPGSITTTSAGGNGCSGGAMFNVTTNAQPVTITSIEAISNSTSTQNVNVYYKSGTYVGSETNAAAWTLIGTYSVSFTTGVLATIDIADLAIPTNATTAFFVGYSAQYTTASSTYSNADLTVTTGAGLCSAFGGVNAGRTFNGKINYSVGIPTSLVWFDAAQGGNNLGTGSPFETVGTTLMPNTTGFGSYTFYVAGQSGGCYSVNRDSVVVNVAPVNYPVIPINASCNGGNNGSFSLGTTGCGVAPFEYSVNGAPFVNTIPADLVAGNYTLIIRDANSDSSAVTPFVIGEPVMPSALTATNVTYYDATLGWSTTGNETSWTVIYGPTGFDPATGGISVPATTTSVFLDNVLAANTSYEFYVFATCGPVPDTAGPFAFATDPGFMAFDNACPPSGFVDISTTGTDLNLTDDSEAGVTLPFSFPYQGTSVTQLTVGNNGGIQLGTLTGQVGYGGNMTSLTGNFLFAWGDDLDDETGNVYWQVQGTSPNQVAIFQWNNQNNFSNGAGTVTFQIQLQENGEIYYVYDDVVFGGTETADDYAANADIGISGPTTDLNVSNNNATYLQNNSCVHFYYALCPNPINATIVNVTPEEVSLDWSPGLYGETNWTIIYGPNGFDPASGTGLTQTSTSSDIIIPGLTQNTEYDFYIYSECAADNLTSGGLLVNVLTPPICSNPTAFAVNALTDTLDASWNWAPTVGYTVNLQYFNVGYVNALPGYTIQTNGEIVNTGSINLYDTIPDANLLAGGVYQVYVQAVCDQVGDTSAWVGPITVVMPLDNDVPCGAETLSLATDYLFNNNGATVDFNETNVAPPATGAQTTDGWANSTLNGTTWFKFVAPASGSVRIDNTLTTYSGQTAVYDAALCSDYSNNFVLLAANDDAIGGTSPASNFTVCGLTPGNEYLIMHDGTGTAGNYSIRVTEIVLEAGTFLPTAQICYGSTIDLTTTITGNDNGGVWSAPIASVNASISGSTFNSNGLGEAIYNFQYRLTDGCAYDSIVSTVQVIAPMSAGTDGTITVCKNQPVDLINVISGNIDLGGTWYDQSTPLAGSEITASSNAGTYNYNYVIGNGVCPDDTSNVAVTVLNTCDYLSLDEQVFAGVSVYPNPSTGLVYVESDNNFEVTVTDANGRTVATAQEVKANNTTTIDLNQVQVGVYFIKLSNADSSKVYRIVVE